MTTLIEVRDKDGHLTRRCDARCYNAKGPKCRCVCDGVNHGVGLIEAKAWTRLCSIYLKEQAPAGHTTKLYEPPTRRVRVAPGLTTALPDGRDDD